jgi:hypothetical protein
MSQSHEMLATGQIAHRFKSLVMHHQLSRNNLSALLLLSVNHLSLLDSFVTTSLEQKLDMTRCLHHSHIALLGPSLFGSELTQMRYLSRLAMIAGPLATALQKWPTSSILFPTGFGVFGLCRVLLAYFLLATLTFRA